LDLQNSIAIQRLGPKARRFRLACNFSPERRFQRSRRPIKTLDNFLNRRTQFDERQVLPEQLAPQHALPDGIQPGNRSEEDSENCLNDWRILEVRQLPVSAHPAHRRKNKYATRRQGELRFQRRSRSQHAIL
jgi:hypothetical protein